MGGETGEGKNSLCAVSKSCSRGLIDFFYIGERERGGRGGKVACQPIGEVSIAADGTGQEGVKMASEARQRRGQHEGEEEESRDNRDRSGSGETASSTKTKKPTGGTKRRGERPALIWKF